MSGQRVVAAPKDVHERRVSQWVGHRSERMNAGDRQDRVVLADGGGQPPGVSARLDRASSLTCQHVGVAERGREARRLAEMLERSGDGHRNLRGSNIGPGFPIASSAKLVDGGRVDVNESSGSRCVVGGTQSCFAPDTNLDHLLADLSRSRRGECGPRRAGTEGRSGNGEGRCDQARTARRSSRRDGTRRYQTQSPRFSRSISPASTRIFM